MQRRTSGLLFLGSAVIAGCGGGGSQNPGSAGRFVPPAGPAYTMTSATVTVQIPARRSQSARRNPKWISPGSATLGVRVLPSPAPNPTPTEQVFTLPSPGPVPTSTTLSVTAPVASDTFVVTAYDGSGHALSTGTSSLTPVAQNGTNTIPVALQGVPSGVVFSVNGSTTPTAWRVLTNLGADQTATINAAPVDAQNNLIPGTLAAAAPVNGTGGVSLSSSSITTATALTATYPHGTNTQGSVTSSLGLNAGASPLNVGVNADSYVFALNSDQSVQVIDVLTRTQVGSTIAGVSANQLAALSGCSTGAFAVEGGASGADIISVPASTVANPTPAPTIASWDPTLLGASPIWSGITADNACNLYYNASDGSLAKFSGFDSTITANPTFATGFTSGQPLSYFDGQISVVNSNASSTYALSVPASSGGAASSSTPYVVPSPDSVFESVLAGTASSVYLITDTCNGQPVLQSLSGGPIITLAEFQTGVACCFSPSVTGAAQAADGTFYLAGVTSGSANVLAYAPLSTIGNSGAPTVPIGGTAQGVLVTPDQQFVCVLESPSGSNGQIEFFQRTPTPVLVGTVALSSTVAPTSFSIGP